ncbi:hypothetical protein CD790_22220 [Streptomyces sp. SAJ15]|nr:hypothetical protein CD790_22220 [Streptomyces sp. SAJ15]
MGCPFLPESIVSPQVRFFPIYFIVPLGICAVVSGAFALRRMRGHEGASRGRARAGITLGSVALVVALTFVVWACWALNHAYE